MLNFAARNITAKGEIEWLRSGDMGVIYDNNLFITGRIKEMIIVRGQNFYAHDIEHAITYRGTRDFSGESFVSSYPQVSLLFCFACRHLLALHA